MSKYVLNQIRGQVEKLCRDFDQVWIVYTWCLRKSAVSMLNNSVGVILTTIRRPHVLHQSQVTEYGPSRVISDGGFDNLDPVSVPHNGQARLKSPPKSTTFPP